MVLCLCGCKIAKFNWLGWLILEGATKVATCLCSVVLFVKPRDALPPKIVLFSVSLTTKDHPCLKSNPVFQVF